MILLIFLTAEQKADVLLDAQHIFSLQLFKEQPKALFQISKDMFTGDFQPTIAHCFAKLLEQKRKLKTCFTQNIDGLERKVGINPKKLIEVHGTLATARCVECQNGYPIADLKKRIIAEETPIYCKCGGLVKPDCVLFDEPLPEKYVVNSRPRDLKKTDLLIMAGTSLQVGPINTLHRCTPKETIRCLLNREKCGMEGQKGLNFDDERDIFNGNDCHQSFYQLAAMAGWEEDLKLIMENCNAVQLQSV